MIFFPPKLDHDHNHSLMRHALSSGWAALQSTMVARREVEEGTITKVYGLNSQGGQDGYDVTVPGRLIPYEKIRPISIDIHFVLGDVVKVLVVYSSDPSKPGLPMILGRVGGPNLGPTLVGTNGTTGPFTPSMLQHGGTTPTTFPNHGNVNIPFPAKTWLTAAGYGWEQNASLFPQVPFNLCTTTADFFQPPASSTVSVSVTTTGGLVVGGIVSISTGGYYQISTVISTTQLLLTNLDYVGSVMATATIHKGAAVFVTGNNDQTWTATSSPPIINRGVGFGASVFISLDPTQSNAVPVVIKINGSAWTYPGSGGGWPAFNGGIELAFSWGGTYGTNTFPANIGLLTSVEVQWAWQGPPIKILQGGDSAASVCCSPRYLGMWPDTTPTTHQILCSMQPNYNANGGHTTSTPITDSGTSGGADYSENLSQTPDPANTLTSAQGSPGMWAGLDALYADSGYYCNASVVYPILLISTGRGSSNLPISYQYNNGSPVLKSETFNAGNVNTVYQDWMSDGSTFVFPVANPSIVNIDSVTDTTTSTTLAYSNTTTTVTLTGGAIPVGDNLEIQMDVNIPSGSGITIGTRYQITTLSSVTVNGVNDPGATFAGNQVTLSLYTNAGDTVVINYNYQQVSYQTDTITPGGTDLGLFPLTKTPISGTLTAPSIDVNSGGQPFQFIVVGNACYINIQLPNSTAWSISYNYQKSDGTLWNMQSMQGFFFDLISNTKTPFTLPLGDPNAPVPIDLNPMRQFTGYVQAGNVTGIPDRWIGNNPFPGQKYSGGTFYNTLKHQLNLAAHDGLYCYDIGSGITTRLPWPTEALTQDLYFSQMIGPLTSGGSSYPLTVDLPECTMPEAGGSGIAGYYCQGATPAYGPVGTFGTYQVPGTAYGNKPIRFFQCNPANNTWSLAGSINPSDIVSSNLGTYPAYIPSTGITHYESTSTDSTVTNGYPTFARGRQQQVRLVDAGWTWSKTASGVLIAVSWSEIHWGYTYPSPITRVNFPDIEVGHSDSGLTLQFVDPLGNKVGSPVTIKSDLLSTHTESNYADCNADALAILASQPAYDTTVPNFSSMSGIWTAALGLTNGTINTPPTLANVSGVGQNIGYLDSFGICLYVYKGTSLDNVNGKDILNMATSRPGIPGIGFRSRFANRTPDNGNTVPGPGTPGQINNEDAQCDDFNGISICTDGNGAYFVLIRQLYWLRNPNQVNEPTGDSEQILWNTPPPGTINSGNTGSWFGGIDSPGAVTGGSYPGLVLGSGTWGWNWFSTTNPGSLHITQFLPDPSATMIGTWAPIGGGESGLGSLGTYTGITGGMGGFAQAGVGIAVLGLALDCRKSFGIGERDILYRFDRDPTSNQITKTYAVDVSQKGILVGPSPITSQAAQMVSVGDPWNRVATIGRFVVLMRAPFSNAYTTPADASMFVDIRLAADGSPQSKVILDPPVPFSAQVPDDVSIVVDTNPNNSNLEWAEITGVIGGNDLRWRLDWSTSPTTPPTVNVSKDQTLYLAPLSNDWRGVAQAQGDWAFWGPNGEVVEASGE